MVGLLATMQKEEVLLGLHQSWAHSVQKNAWEIDRRAFEQLMEDHESELRRIQADAYQVAGMYALFHCVVFTAISESTLLTCQLSWCPVSLCAAVYLATLLAIADNLKMKSDLRMEITQTKLLMSALIDCLDRLEEQG
ncbi:hypothetical protein KP509_34G049900 [Ceratopteris richardii]|nr:hypothetical protein KP509_34G049900 [Ceratopteris richardii]